MSGQGKWFCIEQSHQLGMNFFQRPELPAKEFGYQRAIKSLVKHRKMDEFVSYPFLLQALLQQTHLCGLATPVQPFDYDKLTFHSLVPSKDVTGIDFLLHIVQASIVAVGNDGVGQAFEFIQIIYHFRAKEGRTVLQRGLVDNEDGAFSLDALHHSLNGALAEVVAIRLHGEPIHADDAGFLFSRTIIALVIIIIIARLF